MLRMKEFHRFDPSIMVKEKQQKLLLKTFSLEHDIGLGVVSQLQNSKNHARVENIDCTVSFCFSEILALL
jgi:hypothetical protein